MTYKFLEQLKNKFGTPFYIIDADKFISNINTFKNAIQHYNIPIAIAYSFKTNYTPKLCQLAKDNGCMAEVVSGIELELARKLNFTNGQIIFNGPVKNEEDLKKAIELDAIINLDTLTQVESFLNLDATSKKKAKIGLRLNIDLSEKLLQKKIAKGGILPRFGLAAHEFTKAVELLNQANVPIISIHGHCSSSDRAPENYTAIIQEMLFVIHSNNLNEIKLFNIGGGFAGKMPLIWETNDSPTFNDYAFAINEGLKNSNWYKKYQPQLVIEPGMSIIADAVNLYTSIVAIKELEQQLIVGVDANYFHVRPTLHTKALPYQSFQTNNTNNKNTFVKAVVGATCMERDIVLQDIEIPKPQIGDILSIENVGAYCSVLAPNFISPQPSILIIDATKEKIQVARNAQTFDSFFNGFEF